MELRTALQQKKPLSKIVHKVAMANKGQPKMAVEVTGPTQSAMLRRLKTKKTKMIASGASFVFSFSAT